MYMYMYMYILPAVPVDLATRQLGAAAACSGAPRAPMRTHIVVIGHIYSSMRTHTQLGAAAGGSMSAASTYEDTFEDTYIVV